ncbi:ComF family protein [Hoylesella oralis]|uniref:ComF family protein n=1 Tax=Hoylesella oralis TaxID=28134 RepID=UPI0028E61822|nr:ComF family protein [Hoylesella oralis]
MISFFGRLLDLISPRQCSICGCRLAETEQVLCAVCNLMLPRTGFVDDAYDNEMAQLFWGRLPIERSAALFYYEAQSQVSRMIYELKYRNHPEIGERLGCFMAEELLPKGFFEGIDMIIPVPLARKRQRQRGYNQSTAIARGIQSAVSLPLSEHVLRRNYYHDSQTQKNRWQRADNVEGAFSLCDADTIRDKHLLIVDDVVTTGATVCACGKELMKSGGVRISVLSLGYSKT